MHVLKLGLLRVAFFAIPHRIVYWYAAWKALFNIAMLDGSCNRPYS
jgi:hypothetical protein